MKWKAVVLLVPVLLLSTVGATLAHGARIEYTVVTAVELQATYDNGDPMAGGQVTVYAPDNPSEPWLTGVCDEEGRFVFAPDPDKPGTWDVQVRQAGHGDILHVDIGAGASASGGRALTPSQILLMAASVAWGCVGTALFFSRRQNGDDPGRSSRRTAEETEA